VNAELWAQKLLRYPSLPNSYDMKLVYHDWDRAVKRSDRFLWCSEIVDRSLFNGNKFLFFHYKDHEEIIKNHSSILTFVSLRVFRVGTG
jgi:hypothetical protein